MKIWLQLNEFIEQIPGETNKIIDINLSPIKFHYLNFIHDLNTIQENIHRIETRLSKKNLKIHTRLLLKDQLEVFYNFQLEHIDRFHKNMHKKFNDKNLY